MWGEKGGYATFCNGELGFYQDIFISSYYFGYQHIRYMISYQSIIFGNPIAIFDEILWATT